MKNILLSRPYHSGSVVFLLTLLFLFPSLTVRSQIPYSARVDSIHAFFASGRAGADFCTALAIARQKEHRETGMKLISALLAETGSGIVERFRLMATIRFIDDPVPDSLSRKVRDIWKDEPVSSPRSTHDRVALYTSLLLATELYVDSEPWYDGRSRDELHADATAYLEDWMDLVVHNGQEEFDSPTYGSIFLLSMILLRQFADEEDLRTRADLLTNWLLADYLHEYIGGQFGGAHSRENILSAMQPVGSDLSAIAWLYFGDGAQLYSREQYLASLSSYRPPGAIVDLATKKLKPFESYEIKRSASRVRGDTTAWYPVSKYTYMEALFVMGSIRGGLIQPLEQHSWDVTFVSPTAQTTLFTMHPYSEPSALTEFYPHNAEKVYRTVTALDPYYGTTTKTVGGSPYEQIFQYRNTAIALYEIPDIRRFPFIVTIMPTDVKVFDVDSTKSGWITINTGDVYLAMLPLAPYDLFDKTTSHRLFSSGGRTGAVVHVEGRNTAGSYTSFRKKIRKTRVDTSEFRRTGSVLYKSINGDVLSCRFGEELTVNGSAFSADMKYLFRSPWITSVRGSGVLTVTSGKKKLVIDFPDRKMREK